MKAKLYCLFTHLSLLITTPVFAAEKMEIFDIDFEGGSATEFVASVEGMNLNVLLPSNADEIPIPSFSLRNVTASDLFNALSIFGDTSVPKYGWLTANQNIPMIIDQQTGQLVNAGTNVWVLQVLEPARTAQPFAIGHLINSAMNQQAYTVEQITSAIQSVISAASEISNSSAELEFKYHPDTHLLIISGLANDVRMAGSTLHSLHSSMNASAGLGVIIPN